MKFILTKTGEFDIPEEATDWELFPDDGPEGIIAVIDGKLKFI